MEGAEHLPLIGIDVAPMAWLPRADVEASPRDVFIKITFHEGGGVVESPFRCALMFLASVTSLTALRLLPCHGMAKVKVIRVCNIRPGRGRRSQRNRSRRLIVRNIRDANQPTQSAVAPSTFKPTPHSHISLPLPKRITAAITQGNAPEFPPRTLIPPLLFRIQPGVGAAKAQGQHALVVAAVDLDVQFFEALEDDDWKAVLGEESEVGEEEVVVVFWWRLVSRCMAGYEEE